MLQNSYRSLARKKVLINLIKTLEADEQAADQSVLLSFGLE